GTLVVLQQRFRRPESRYRYDNPQGEGPPRQLLPRTRNEGRGTAIQKPGACPSLSRTRRRLPKQGQQYKPQTRPVSLTARKQWKSRPADPYRPLRSTQRGGAGAHKALRATKAS